MAVPELEILRRRTLGLLTAGQILGGLGVGASVSVGALAASNLAGEAWSGIAASMTTLGAAAVAIPLARLADRRGRRVSLSSAALIAAAGAALCVMAVSSRNAVALFLGLGLLGSASAAGLQSRFAATDLASVRTRGRDLSLVVWSTTIGAVTGPNLAQPGDVLGAALGLPTLAGVFLLPVVAQLLAAAVYLVGMRPDPLLESRRVLLVAGSRLPETAIEDHGDLLKPEDPGGLADRIAPPASNPTLVRVAMITLALSHATMVALMSMTPVHLVHGGATLSVVGFTLSLHIAGMFGLSPIFGILSDRIGRIPTIFLGQTLLVAAGVTTALGADQTGVVMVGLTLLGLGWSASTVAASALLNDAANPATRVRDQGRSDLVMNLAGAAGGALSGPTLALIGYPGLAWAVLIPVGIVFTVVTVGRRRAMRDQLGQTNRLKVSLR